MLLWILWMAKKLTLILKLNSHLKLNSGLKLENFFSFFPSPNICQAKSENYSILTMCLSCLFKEIQPFENYKIHRNVLEIHFSHDPKLLGHACMSMKFPQEILVGIPWGWGVRCHRRTASQPSIHTNRHHTDQISRSALRDGATNKNMKLRISDVFWLSKIKDD